MDDEKPEKPEVGEDLDIEDLDVDEAAAEAVKGGSGGGDLSSTGNIKREW